MCASLFVDFVLPSQDNGRTVVVKDDYFSVRTASPCKCCFFCLFMMLHALVAVYYSFSTAAVAERHAQREGSLFPCFVRLSAFVFILPIGSLRPERESHGCYAPSFSRSTLIGSLLLV
jgi:hypothetical protein